MVPDHVEQALEVVENITVVDGALGVDQTRGIEGCGDAFGGLGEDKGQKSAFVCGRRCREDSDAEDDQGGEETFEARHLGGLIYLLFFLEKSCIWIELALDDAFGAGPLNDLQLKMLVVVGCSFHGGWREHSHAEEGRGHRR